MTIRVTHYLKIIGHWRRNDHGLSCGHFAVNLLNKYSSPDCIGDRLEGWSFFCFLCHLTWRGEGCSQPLSDIIRNSFVLQLGQIIIIVRSKWQRNTNKRSLRLEYLEYKLTWELHDMCDDLSLIFLMVQLCVIILPLYKFNQNLKYFNNN